MSPPLKIDLPKLPRKIIKKETNIPKNKDVINTKSEPEIEITANIELTIDNILANWEGFKVIITKEKFLLGPLLEHSTPLAIQKDNLVIGVNNKEDVPILNSSNDFLSKRFSAIYKSKLKFDFKFERNPTPNSTVKEVNSLEELDETYKDIPIVKSIVDVLGGREIK